MIVFIMMFTQWNFFPFFPDLRLLIDLIKTYYYYLNVNTKCVCVLLFF